MAEKMPTKAMLARMKKMLKKAGGKKGSEKMHRDRLGLAMQGSRRG